MSADAGVNSAGRVLQQLERVAGWCKFSYQPSVTGTEMRVRRADRVLSLALAEEDPKAFGASIVFSEDVGEMHRFRVGPCLMLRAYQAAMAIPAEMDDCTMASFETPTADHYEAANRVSVWLDDMQAGRQALASRCWRAIAGA